MVDERVELANRIGTKDWRKEGRELAIDFAGVLPFNRAVVEPVIPSNLATRKRATTIPYARTPFQITPLMPFERSGEGRSFAIELFRAPTDWVEPKCNFPKATRGGFDALEGTRPDRIRG